MGKRGPRKMPQSLRVLRGSAAKAQDLLEFGSLWEPPDYMKAAQRRIWETVLDRAPWLTGSDTDVVEAYVNALAEYRRAAVKVQSSSQIVKAANGVEMINPFLKVMTIQAQLLAKFGSELGLSPASRASIGAALDRGKGNRSQSLQDFLAEAPVVDVQEVN